MPILASTSGGLWALPLWPPGGTVTPLILWLKPLLIPLSTDKTRKIFKQSLQGAQMNRRQMSTESNIQLDNLVHWMQSRHFSIWHWIPCFPLHAQSRKLFFYPALCPQASKILQKLALRLVRLVPAKGFLPNSTFQFQCLPLPTHWTLNMSALF